jgi:uncharacterized protein
VKRFIIDTGPLVAFFSRDDTHHKWVTQSWNVNAKFLTCEAVLTEAAFLLRKRAGLVDSLFQLVEEATIDVRGMGNEIGAVRRLMKRYQSVPMSFVDACLVRMSELDTAAVVSTCDADFKIYRRLGRQVIPLLAPFV